MPTDDVVAELDEWLEREATTLKHYPSDDTDTGLLQRARDEIVALRQLQLANVEGNKWLRDNDERVFLKAINIACTEARAEALEEAALACERRRDETGPQEAYAVVDVESYISACGGCAAAIRALKDKGDG